METGWRSYPLLQAYWEILKNCQLVSNVTIIIIIDNQKVYFFHFDLSAHFLQMCLRKK